MISLRTFARYTFAGFCAGVWGTVFHETIGYLPLTLAVTVASFLIALWAFDAVAGRKP